MKILNLKKYSTAPVPNSTKIGGTGARNRYRGYELGTGAVEYFFYYYSTAPVPNSYPPVPIPGSGPWRIPSYGVIIISMCNIHIVYYIL